MLSSFRYVRGVARSVRRGDTFPAAGRIRPRPAPGGSTASPLPRWHLDERFLLQTTTHRVFIPGLTETVRVLHLSDVHLRGPEPWVDHVVRAIRDLKPDLVALTGDIVTRGFVPEVAAQFLDAVPSARFGRFAVMGNWEVWGGAPRSVWEPVLNAHDVQLLHNRNVDLGPLTICGTDDLLSGTPDIEAAIRGIPADRPTLALTHSPGIFPDLARPPVNVVLAGHTHGGQVNLPGLGPFFLPRGTGIYPWGWYEHAGAWMFVHRGLGWSVAPLRWRAPPEIAWIELCPG